MTRNSTLVLVLTLLLVLLAAPAMAQETATSGPPESPSDATAAPAETEVPEAAVAPAAIPAGEGPVVQAVFFFSPSCGHCEYVITQVLPGLFADNGGEYVVTYDESVLPESPSFYLMSNGRLQLLMVDISTEGGSEAFQQDSERLGIDQAGVPRIDFAEAEYLVGSADIPKQFPGVVADGLAGNGLTWPPTPGLEAAIAPFITEGSVTDPDAGATPAPADSSEEASDATAVLPLGGGDDGWTDRFGRDVAGNSISLVVLLLLLISLIAAPVLAARGSLPGFPGWLVVVLAAIGLGVAAYLANVETTGAEAACGPVGDCNAVQASDYAWIAGVPVGVLGVVGYLAIGAMWIISRLARGTLADVSVLLIGVGAWLGTLFSIYLTFLEPFVIGATCMWCITSAVVMMALLWVSAAPAHDAWQRLRHQPSQPAPAGA